MIQIYYCHTLWKHIYNIVYINPDDFLQRFAQANLENRSEPLVAELPPPLLQKQPARPDFFPFRFGLGASSERDRLPTNRKSAQSDLHQQNSSLWVLRNRIQRFLVRLGPTVGKSIVYKKGRTARLFHVRSAVVLGMETWPRKEGEEQKKREIACVRSQERIRKYKISCLICQKIESVPTQIVRSHPVCSLNFSFSEPLLFICFIFKNLCYQTTPEITFSA